MSTTSRVTCVMPTTPKKNWSFGTAKEMSAALNVTASPKTTAMMKTMSLRRRKCMR